MAKAKKDKPKKDEEKKKNTSLRLDNKTLKALKIRAIEEEVSVQRVVESLVEAWLNGTVTVDLKKIDDEDV